MLGGPPVLHGWTRWPCAGRSHPRRRAGRGIRARGGVRVVVPRDRCSASRVTLGIRGHDIAESSTDWSFGGARAVPHRRAVFAARATRADSSTKWCRERIDLAVSGRAAFLGRASAVALTKSLLASSWPSSSDVMALTVDGLATQRVSVRVSKACARSSRSARRSGRSRKPHDDSPRAHRQPR